MPHFIKATDDSFIYYDALFKSNSIFPIGKVLFDFLELDLTLYEQLRKRIIDYVRMLTDSAALDRSSFCLQEMKKLYPQTAAFLRIQYPHLFKCEETEITCCHTNDMIQILHFYLTGNKDINREVYLHPYIRESLLYTPTPILSTFLSECCDGFDLLKYQMLYDELINFCLIEDHDPAFTPLQKYYLFAVSHPANTALKAEIRYAPFFSSELEDVAAALQSGQRTARQMEKYRRMLKTHSVGLLPFCEQVSDYLFFEFYEMVSRNISIQHCKNCGNYFVITDPRSTLYCSRRIGEKNLTCKKVGIQNTRKNLVSSNPILKEYERAYKRNYFRMTNEKMTDEDFVAWLDDAKKYRDEILIRYTAAPSEQLITDFKSYLGNQ